MKFKSYIIHIMIFRNLFKNIYALTIFYTILAAIYIILGKLINQKFGDFSFIFASICIFVFIYLFFLISTKIIKTNDTAQKRLYFTIPVIIITIFFILLNIFPIFFYNQLDNIWELSIFLPILGSALVIGLKGVLEEVFFRGIMLKHLIKKIKIKTPRSLLLPIILSSLSFAILHLLNLINPNVILVFTLSQVIYAFFFGIAFALIYILSNYSLMTVMIIHFFINFSNIGIKLVKYEQISPSGILIFLSQLSIIVIPLSVLIFILYKNLKNREVAL